MTNSEITTIYIVRHGQSLSNAAYESGKIQHSTDYGELQSPLSELGKKQAREVAKKLRSVHFDAIFSSDLNRAVETAKFIAEDRNLTVKTEKTIRERMYGTYFYSLTKEQREEAKKALQALNEEEKLLHKFSPDGESSKDIINRFESFIHEIIKVYKGKTILVVNHGNVMRMFLVHIGWGKFDEIPSGAIKNTGYYVLETDGKMFTVKETYGVNKKQSFHEE